jgi:methyltransferase (TIGR00027 family)
MELCDRTAAFPDRKAPSPAAGGEPSRTAQYVALFRSLESARRRDRLFTDALAPRFLPPRLRLAAEAARVPGVGVSIERFIDRRWPGARASAVARTRLIDGWATDALRDGARQVLVLGAGFDARAYRLADMSRARVFEVDQPATLAVKRQAVRAALGHLPAHVSYVEVDFNTGRLADELAAAGFDPGLPTCTIWEGVTHYLTEEAVRATFGYVAGATPPGSRVMWTYVHRGVIDGSREFDGGEAARAAVSRAGEPWVVGFVPSELPAYLSECGLSLLDDVGSADYRRRFLNRRGNHLRGYDFYRAALAETVGD